MSKTLPLAADMMRIKESLRARYFINHPVTDISLKKFQDNSH